MTQTPVFPAGHLIMQNAFILTSKVPVALTLSTIFERPKSKIPSETQGSLTGTPYKIGGKVHAFGIQWDIVNKHSDIKRDTWLKPDQNPTRQTLNSLRVPALKVPKSLTASAPVATLASPYWLLS